MCISFGILTEYSSISPFSLSTITVAVISSFLRCPFKMNSASATLLNNKVSFASSKGNVTEMHKSKYWSSEEQSIFSK